MTNYVQIGGLQVADCLKDFIENEAMPETGITPEQFWSGLENIVNTLGPRNKALIEKRSALQTQINNWHKANPDMDTEAYKAFLVEIGYLVPESEDFSIRTQNVDDEIATIAGPQLVVPVNNARFALNAANARWGSLYDALYGTDAIAEDGGCERSGGFNEKRAAKVVTWGNEFLDKSAPLSEGKYADVTAFNLEQDGNQTSLNMTLSNGNTTTLADNAQFVGFHQDTNTASILLKKHGLHVEIQIDSNHPIGQQSAAGVKDVVIESAMSTIMDCEDSVAAVDAEDKTIVYRNWLGLMKGSLESTFNKGGKSMTRKLNADRTFNAPNGEELTLHGRSLLLVRNVGHLMTNPAILDKNGNEVFEGLMDAMVTTLCTMHDLKGNSTHRNSRTGSMYIVKPKMHGPEEVAFTNEIFGEVEKALDLPAFTLKVGVMDEERRTSANLKACIAAVPERLVFINTGFLDRTGDEMHTSMDAGAMLPKGEIKGEPWIAVYEDRNVDIGLACGLQGKAQIGKGMWAMPDEMAAMLDAKTGHPLAGANCAWVPSPTAATLHATHYHDIDVFARQNELKARGIGSLDTLLTPPIMKNNDLSSEQIQAELDNNAQGILGYVVRWVEQGVGCSKVPDINNIGLMEDRATLRISSQHIANWLHHGICSEAQVMETMKRMAAVVDNQNAGDTAYRNMAPGFDTVAFEAACDLVFKGTEQPSGYTEPLLHARRIEAKKVYS